MFSVVSYELLYGKTGGGHAEYEYTEAGTYTINIPENVVADIAIVGGGGGATYFQRIVGQGLYIFLLALGGSGAAIVGTFKMTAGTYNVTVGDKGAIAQTSDPNAIKGGDSIIAKANTNIIVAGGGIVAGGSLTTSFSDTTIQKVNTSVESNGNDGFAEQKQNVAPTPPSPYTGGQSLYKGYGKGVGYENSSLVADNTGGYFYLKY